MGLIKAAKAAIGSTMQDQWKEAIRCEDMTNEILMVKKTTPTGVITNKSTIIVAPGQCAVIYDNGRVIDATAEDGIYTFDSSSSPSFFAGQFGEVFKEMWQRFTYNGATSKEQAVFFFNIKEIIDNKFGTTGPISFQDWSHPIPNQMTNTISPMRVEIKCYGTYTFSIMDPALFMTKLAGTSSIYKKSQVVEQFRSEIIAVVQNVANELGTEKYKVPVLEMESQTDEIRQMMDEKVFDEKIRERGIKIESLVIEKVTLSDDTIKKIDQYEYSSNAYLQQGEMTKAYSEAVKSAAENKYGSMSGFMGIGMMNMSTGNVMGETVSGIWQNTDKSSVDLSKQQTVEETKEEQPKVAENIAKENTKWTCDCGTENTGKFCPNCGKPKKQEKICKKCNTKLETNAKFCSNCGEKID